MTNLENNDEMMMEASGNSTMLGDEGVEYISPRVEKVFGEDGDDTITGFLTGDEPGSTLFGNGGDDYIRSRGIGDKVFGGRGNDTIVNDNGRVLIYGDLGSDYLIAKDSRTTLFGGRSFGNPEDEEGQDTLESFGGKNILIGGGGNDYLIGVRGEDTMAGGLGDDTIKGGPEGASFLFGNAGKDSIVSTSNDDPDTLFGGRGDDTLKVIGEADGPALFGGVGGDHLSINVNVNNAIIFGDVGPDGRFGGSEGEEPGADYFDIQGGKGHTLAGNAGDDTFQLGSSVGQTSIYAGQGDDFITGSAGVYTGLEVFGDRGNDTISFIGSVSVSNSIFSGDNANITSDFGKNVIQVRGSNNALYGVAKEATGSGAGNNFIQAIAVDLENRGSTNNLLVGGAGNDTIDAGSSGAGDTLNGGPAGDNTYIFGPGQTIVQDTVGINTYFGIKADQDDAVTVTQSDIIGGAANFFITGKQSNVQTLGTGGIITTDSDKTQVLTVDNASGTTKTGGGDDQLKFGNVSGLVDAGAGNDTIGISGSVSGVVDGGAGDDTINITGSDGVTESGSVLGGDGNDLITIDGEVSGKVDGGLGDDTISAESLIDGGVVSGGEGNDSIVIETMSGGEIDGGAGNDFINVELALAGAVLGATGGDNKIILDNIGSGEGETIEITTAGGNDRIGLAIGGESGDVPVSLTLNAGAGINVIQGGAFRDIITAGGNDLVYGGSPNFDDTGSSLNSLDISVVGSAAFENLTENFVNFGDGDSIDVSTGNDTIAFRSLGETGFIQLSMGSTTYGSTEFGGSDGNPGDAGNLFVDANGEFLTGNIGSDGSAYASAAFNIDTLTGFSRGNDKIVLDFNQTEMTGFFKNQVIGSGAFVGTISVFTGQGALYGAIVDGSTGNNDPFLNNAFNDEFVIGTGNDFIGSNLGQISFDSVSSGLYIGDGSQAVLFAQLPGVEIGQGDANDIVFSSTLSLTAAGGQTAADVSLF